MNFLCWRLRLLGTQTDGDYYLQAIAVDQAYRGQQIGTKLLEAIEEQARTHERGHAVISRYGRQEQRRTETLRAALLGT
jgi:GNAT superfamily N-acetyltransferase